MIPLVDGGAPPRSAVSQVPPAAPATPSQPPPPGQQQTDAALAKAKQSGAAVINLEAQQAAGQNVSTAQINQALHQYEQDQQALRVALENELKASRAAGQPTTIAAVFKGQENDPEVQAVTAIENAAKEQGTDAQFDALVGALPKGSNPATIEFVMADPAAQKIIDDYVGEVGDQVAWMYNNWGPWNAADRLQQAVTAHQKSAVGAQLAALIINRCLPTIRQITERLPGLKHVPIMGPSTRWQGTQSDAHTPGQVIIVADLAQSVEIAAAGSNPSTGTYDTPEIQQAVTGVAHLLAAQPDGNVGPSLKDAASQGYVTLGLATALETLHLQPSDLPPEAGQRSLSAAEFANWKTTAANATLGNVASGIGEFQHKVDTTLTSVATSAAPLAAQGQYSQVLTEDQFKGGISGLSNGVPASGRGPAVKPVAGVKQSIQNALNKVEEVGYQLVGVDQAVTFYETTSLGTMSGFTGVDNARGTLMSNPNSMAAELGSPDARNRVVGATLRQALPAKLQHGGTGPQYYGVTAQFVGDFTEFLAENYLAKVNSPAEAPGSLVLGGAGGDQMLPAERIGHSPFALAWLGGGAAQLVLTDYVAQNVTFGGPFATERKMVTLLIIGGFGGLHTYQSGAAVARWLAQKGWLGDGLGGDNKVVPDTLLDKATRLTVEPTLGLIQSLTVLMGLATIADAAGAVYDYTGAQSYFNSTSQVGAAAGHTLNFTADLVLLRLQARGWAEQSFGKAILSDSTLSAAFKSQLSNAMLKALGVKVAQQPSPTMLKLANDILAHDPQLRKEALDYIAQNASFRGGGAMALPRVVKNLTGRFQDYIGRLSPTRQQSLAAKWAIDGKLEGVDVSRVTDFLKTSQLLNNLSNLPIPKSLQAMLAKRGLTMEDYSPPGLANALKNSLVSDGADGLALDVTEEAAIDWNPIGWAVNVIYLGTTVTNAVISQFATRDKFQTYEYTFLRGAGMNDAQARAMAAHSLWSGHDASSGLLQAYIDMGGDPSQFIDYVNSINPDTLNKTLSALSPLSLGTKLPATSATDFWNLPTNPDDPAQRRFSAGVTYNTADRKWEDKALGVYFSGGEWVSTGQVVPEGDYYDPATQSLIEPPDTQRPSKFGSWSEVTAEAPQSVDGLRTWFASNNVPLPPKANS